MISLNWTSITDPSYTGGSPIVYYEVRYKQNPGDTYTALTTYSRGVTYYFDHIISTPFPPNQNVYYTICAQNMVAMGACSPDFAVLTCNYPTFMNPPIYSNQIKPPWIYLTWTPITDSVSTGRAVVTFYDLMWDQGSGQTTWVSLITLGSSMVTSFNHTIWPSVFPSGQVNSYMLRAWNGVGAG